MLAHTCLSVNEPFLPSSFCNFNNTLSPAEDMYSSPCMSITRFVVSLKFASALSNSGAVAVSSLPSTDKTSVLPSVFFSIFIVCSHTVLAVL